MTARTAEERALIEKVATSLEAAGIDVRRNVTVDGASAAFAIGGRSAISEQPACSERGPEAFIPAANRQVAADDNTNPPLPVANGALDLQQPAGTAPNDPKRANVGRLPQFVTRIEKLEEERKAIGGDIKDVYSEAKGAGYDVKTIRKLVALRRMDAADRAEQETLLDVYKHALGMI